MVPVMVTHPMTVLRIVLVHGAVMLISIIVIYVIQMLLMIVNRIVLGNGVVVLM